MRGAFQYIAGSTPIHRLHPLVKILYLFLTLAVVLIPYHPDTKSLLAAGIWVAVGVILWLLARMGWSSFSFLFKFLSAIFLFLIVTQGFLYQSTGPDLFRFGHLEIWGSDVGKVSVEGVFFGIILSLRILAATLALPVLVATTSSSQLMAALSSLRVPARIAFVFVSALSFTHLVIQLWENILEAQKLRAFDIEAMGLFQRTRRAYVPVITPLILLLFRKGNDLQVALESKAFGAPGPKTQMEVLPWKLSDTLAALSLLLAFAAVLAVRFSL